MPRSETPPLPTRRQLDELDALLQRMLELPVNHAAETGLPPVELPQPEDRPFTETSAWTSKWEETTTSSERDFSSPAPPVHETPEWRPRWASVGAPPPAMPETPQLEFPPLAEENASPERETPASQAWEGIASQGSSRNLSEPRRFQFQPPTLHVLLGWLGFACFVASLALLAYDWFGWTW
jgi:hypothetical protein